MRSDLSSFGFRARATQRMMAFIDPKEKVSAAAITFAPVRVTLRVRCLPLRSSLRRTTARDG